VIGGGDWSDDRLIPDCIRAFDAGRPVTLRYPDALRPWQHVLDPLGGYLVLTEDLATNSRDVPEAVNFGPASDDADLSVSEVAKAAARLWGAGEGLVVAEPSVAHETGVLRIDSSLATASLGWQPVWPAAAALERTVDWYRAHRDGADMAALTDKQITEHSRG
jgi:CDP-glucose 4,6-dehydratase